MATTFASKDAQIDRFLEFKQFGNNLTGCTGHRRVKQFWRGLQRPTLRNRTH